MGLRMAGHRLPKVPTRGKPVLKEALGMLARLLGLVPTFGAPVAGSDFPTTYTGEPSSVIFTAFDVELSLMVSPTFKGNWSARSPKKSKCILRG